MENKQVPAQSTPVVLAKIVGWMGTAIGLLLAWAVLAVALMLALDIPRPLAVLIVFGVAGLVMEDALTEMAYGRRGLPVRNVDRVGKFLAFSLSYILLGAHVTRTLCELALGELTTDGQLLGIAVVTALGLRLLSLAPRLFERPE